jgi:hypothetical protein
MQRVLDPAQHAGEVFSSIQILQNIGFYRRGDSLEGIQKLPNVAFDEVSSGIAPPVGFLRKNRKEQKKDERR